MNYALIVAAGKGTRMKGPKAKQYLPLAGLPILSRTVLAFVNCPLVDEIFISVAPAEHQYCQQQIVELLNISKPLTLVPGGESRQESVFNGLAGMSTGDHYVGIHDGVRPFITPDQIEACFKTAHDQGLFAVGMCSSQTVNFMVERMGDASRALMLFYDAVRC